MQTWLTFFYHRSKNITGQWWGRDGVCQTKARKLYGRKSNKWRPT